jgi:hypothetical protein
MANPTQELSCGGEDSVIEEVMPVPLNGGPNPFASDYHPLLQ